MSRKLMRAFLGCVLVVCWFAATAVAADQYPGLTFLNKVDAAVASGQLTEEQGLLYKIQYGFAPEKLPAEYRPEGFYPLKNATEIIWQYEQMRDRLSPRMVAEVDGYLSPPAAKSTYLSLSGRFRLTYDTVGTNAVPATDTNPANGIPDFVEKCASYMDTSWDTEVTTLGFTAPPLSPYYEVGFESMSYYGYTSAVGTYGSRITLHNTFLGFPPNNDPEGNQWGAAKVTCAHEFKHATQRAGSRWTEGGWVEVDATWAEDIVYDAVNDYYNYLPYGSPISSPATSLDSGGSGSYEDCIWQHWMSETWGNQMIVDLWDWRITHTSQTMMDSYEAMLNSYGTTLSAGWPVFTTWNYATGSRIIAGIGYGEARNYPSSSVTGNVSTYPTTRTGTVAHLAANFYRCTSFSSGAGTVEVQFDGADGSQIALSAVIKKRDLTGVIEHIPLDAANDADVALATPREDILEIGFSISNAAKSGANQSYSLTVDQQDYVVPPGIHLDVTSFTNTMETNTTDTDYLQVTNDGDPGSTLNYSVTVQGNPPPAGKSIAGSTMSCSPNSYIPDTTVNLDFTVTNGSPDDEWLTDVTLDFPSGITVNSAGNFVGGTYGDLVSDGATGNGVVVTWHGDTGAPYYYGVIQGGESATARINVTFASGLIGTKFIAYSITGDQWGGAPHTLTGNVALTQVGPSVQVTFPNGGETLLVGDLATLTWTSVGGLTDVKLDLSRDGGTGWEPIVASTPNDGSYDWTVSTPGSYDCLLRVSSLDDTITDESDATFGITESVEWLTVTPTSGSLGQGETDILTLNYDTSGLSAGSYTAYIVIHHDAAGSPEVLPVNLTVTDNLSAVGDTPYAFRLAGNYPNPFNPITSLSFTLGRTGTATVDVLDLQGRLVRSLWNGRLEAGPHTFRWDGRDGDGRTVAAGVYLGRLRADERIATCKMILAK
jgi:hypothetical protein